MEPITWITVATVLAKYGPEVADFIITRALAGDVVMLDEWERLQALAARPPQTQLADAVARAGLSPSDPRVVALLDMLPGQS